MLGLCLAHEAPCQAAHSTLMTDQVIYTHGCPAVGDAAGVPDLNGGVIPTGGDKPGHRARTGSERQRRKALRTHPAVDHATARISDSCPRSTCSGIVCSAGTSAESSSAEASGSYHQMHASPFRSPVTRRLPSGDHATQRTAVGWRYNTLRGGLFGAERPKESFSCASCQG